MTNVRYYTREEIVSQKASFGVGLKAEYGNKLEFADGTTYALDIITRRYYFCICAWL